MAAADYEDQGEDSCARVEADSGEDEVNDGQCQRPHEVEGRAVQAVNDPVVRNEEYEAHDVGSGCPASKPKFTS